MQQHDLCILDLRGAHEAVFALPLHNVQLRPVSQLSFILQQLHCTPWTIIRQQHACCTIDSRSAAKAVLTIAFRSHALRHRVSTSPDSAIMQPCVFFHTQRRHVHRRPSQYNASLLQSRGSYCKTDAVFTKYRKP